MSKKIMMMLTAGLIAFVLVLSASVATYVLLHSLR